MRRTAAEPVAAAASVAAAAAAAEPVAAADRYSHHPADVQVLVLRPALGAEDLPVVRAGLQKPGIRADSSLNEGRTTQYWNFQQFGRVGLYGEATENDDVDDDAERPWHYNDQTDDDDGRRLEEAEKPLDFKEPLTIEEWLRRRIAAGHRPDEVAPTELRPFKVKDDTTGEDESTSLRGAHRKRRTAAAEMAFAKEQGMTIEPVAELISDKWIADKWVLPPGFEDKNLGRTCVDWPGVVEFWKYEKSAIPSDELTDTGEIEYMDEWWAYSNNDRPGYCLVGSQRLHLPGVGNGLDDNAAAAAAAAVSVAAAAEAVAAAAVSVAAAAVAAAAEAVAAAAVAVTAATPPPPPPTPSPPPPSPSPPPPSPPWASTAIDWNTNPKAVRLTANSGEHAHFEYELPEGTKDIVVAFGAVDDASKCQLGLGDDAHGARFWSPVAGEPVVTWYQKLPSPKMAPQEEVNALLKSPTYSFGPPQGAQTARAAFFVRAPVEEA